jgi:hypothetical protein
LSIKVEVFPPSNAPQSLFSPYLPHDRHHDVKYAYPNYIDSAQI